MLSLAIAATVQIGVLGTFHPLYFEVGSSQNSALVLQLSAAEMAAAQEARPKPQLIPSGTWTRVDGPARITGPGGGLARFRLKIPGVVEQEYFGRLKITRGPEGWLHAVVEMDTETAVASIVEAEGDTSIPFEARKAQAIVTRSYLLGAAHGRHAGFDFCDKDHCQRMRGVVKADSDARRATDATRGQVIAFNGTVVPGLYSANCGGHTQTLVQAGWDHIDYPYFQVACPLRGKVSGHRLGLCQMGAITIAKTGVGADVILAHYFPQTSIESVEFISGKDARAMKLARGKSVRPESPAPVRAASSWTIAQAGDPRGGATRSANRPTLQ
jgi:peptidoglycan hydrolase-like amidase